jgi:hypothetical protein
MAEVHPQNPGPWEEWRDFPDGPIKEAIEAMWENNLASEEKVGAHFALQVKGTNPISGYRVYVV